MVADTQTMTETELENETVTVEIYHGEIGADATADVRCFGLGELTQDVFDEHYESLGEPVDFPVGRVARKDAETVLDVLEDVWMRTQGGRNDPVLPYNGSQVRSSMVGDVVVLDGVPFAVADVGFERVELDVDQDDEDEHFDAEEETVSDAWEGAYIYTSWGYGQTNVEIAQIVDVSDTGKTVLARLVVPERVDTAKGSESLQPSAEHYGDEFRLHVRSSAGDPAFRGSYPYVDGDAENGTRRGSFLPWSGVAGSTVHQTAPGYGH